MSTPISDEQLNAFIDSQLGPEEQEMVFEALKQDEALSQKACKIHRLQDMVRHAYAELPPTPARKVRRSHGFIGKALAASVLLVVGAGAGWLAHSTQARIPHEPQLKQASYERQELDAFQTVQLMSAQDMQQNVVLHITTSNPQKLAYALDEVDSLLGSYKARGLSIRLEVVANGDGMALLRSDVSPYPQRTQELIHKYDNLAVLACANTLKWLQDQGVKADVLPDVGLTKSGLERVVDRLQEGWLYIKV
jgi:intracellular sulfur oxidation DsrE/DsrF family protein